jgi:acetylornithine deacetylase/succinyl-diaminopimelate desuccinylase family protein
MLSPVIDTLASLVRINSVNSAYDGGPGEGEIAAWITRFFQQRGIKTWQQEVFPGRPNVLALLPGEDSSRQLVLEAHMDTVSVQGMSIDPFEPRIIDGRLYGRGSCDTKAGLAGMMHALADLHERGVQPPQDILLAAVVDEEHSYRGVVKLCEGLKAQAAIVAEPTELRCVTASKGVLRFRITVAGKSAHSGKPHLGVNAINHMARIILAIEADHQRLAQNIHPLLGPATCNIGVIQGGVQINFVPDQCSIQVDRRLLPHERATAILAHYQNLLDQLSTQHPDLCARIEDPPLLVDEALETPPHSPVARLGNIVLQTMGRDGSAVGVPFGSDASKLSRAGIPSIIFGPGSIDQAHAAVEYVDIDQVEAACEFYQRFVMCS